MDYQIEDAERIGVAGNGLGLLNGQTAKQNSITSVEGVGNEVVDKAGL
jgi:hypothetical protein